MQPKTKLNNKTKMPDMATLGVALALLSLCNSAHAQHTESGVGVYYGIPDPSNHGILSGQSPYIVEVRAKGTALWLSPHVFYQKLNDTYATGTHETNQRYYENLWSCSHSYVNFEMSQAAEIRITKRVGTIDAQKTKVHPANKVTSISYGSNSMTFEMPVACNIAVDIDGKMADRPHNVMGQAAGSHPVDTLSIHGNPPISDKPTLGSSAVLAVEPNPNPNVVSSPPQSFSESTMYFKPGIHYIGNNFKVYPGKRYYIPGDAVVYGTFNNVNDASVPGSPTLPNANNITIYGHGTICGSKFNHWEMDQVELDGSYDGSNLQTVLGSDKDSDPNTPGDQHTSKYLEQQRISYRKTAIGFDYCMDTRVEGIVILDSANHNLSLFTPNYVPATPNRVSWVKIFSWRVNSDGSGINDNSMVENCFYRVQDDGFYPKGITLRNHVLWSDSNGACLRFSHLFQLKKDEMTVENIDVIFRRNMWWSNSGAIEMPGSNEKHLKPFVFSNINISDSRANRPMVNIQMDQGGELANVTFRDMQIASNTVKNKLKTTGNGIIRDIIFDNVTIGGQLLTEANYPDFFDEEGGNIYGLQFTSGGGSGSGGALSRDTWSFTSNPAWGWLAPDKVKDGLANTRWDTSTPQTIGQYFEVDLGSTQNINRIVADSSGSPGDYPRGYVIETKLNGGNYTAVVTTPFNSDTNGIDVTFTPTMARFVRVRLTDSSSFNWWSIHELNVYAPAGSGGQWSSSNIGGGTGSSTVNSGTWTLHGMGGDIFGGSDNFHYRYQPMTGDFTIVAEVDSVQSSQQWAKAGLMIREGLEANARNAFVNLSPTSTIRFQRRLDGAASTIEDMVNAQNNPRFLKLSRSGNVFKAFYAGSLGGPWTQLGNDQNIDMSATVNVGLAVSSYSSAENCQASIKNVSVLSP